MNCAQTGRAAGGTVAATQRAQTKTMRRTIMGLDQYRPGRLAMDLPLHDVQAIRMRAHGGIPGKVRPFADRGMSAAALLAERATGVVGGIPRESSGPRSRVQAVSFRNQHRWRHVMTGLLRTAAT